MVSIQGKNAEHAIGAHANDFGRRLQAFHCQADHTEQEAYEFAKGCETDQHCRWPSVLEYDERHDRCLYIMGSLPECSYDDLTTSGYDSDRMYIPAVPDVALNLGLLRVSRQIHNEAALLPFQLNTFHFMNGFDFDLFFSKALCAEQRQAVQAVHFNDPLEGRYCRRGTVPCIQRRTVLSLKRLEAVSFTHQIDLDIRPEEGMDAFSGLGLRSSTVLVTPLGCQKDRVDPGEYGARECDISCLVAKRIAEQLEFYLRQGFPHQAAAKRRRDEEKEQRMVQEDEKRRQMTERMEWEMEEQRKDSEVSEEQDTDRQCKSSSFWDARKAMANVEVAATASRRASTITRAAKRRKMDTYKRSKDLAETI